MKKIGRYIVRGLLGRGGMSKVYRVSLPVIGNTSALKLLDPHPSLTALLGSEKIRECFSAEARTMAGLRHPHIAAIRDFDEADGQLFYVMEYFSNNMGDLIGETYRTEAPSRILSIDRAIHYTRQLLAGVARLHHDNILHRDIKPFNLLITEEDTVKICDFGLSTLRGETSTGPDNLKIGSPFYAAPEQEDSPDQAGFESDIFSIGVVLYRMVTGQLPYMDTRPPTPPSHLNPNLDSNWDDFIFSAIHKVPRARTATVKEMSGGLEQLAAAWTDKKNAICQLAEPKPVISASPLIATPTPLRSSGIKVPPSLAGEVFQTNTLGHPLLYRSPSFRELSPSLISDPGRGLIWQQAGSEYPLSWQGARAYIDRLNQRQCQRIDSWRLPTVEELMSLLTPPLHDDALCIPPLFEPKQKWLWSADRSTFTAAWYVNLELGFVAKSDFSALYYAKAVCSRQSSSGVSSI
ncbi:MAG: protein kinase [Pseudomonadota bacterium]